MSEHTAPTRRLPAREPLSLAEPLLGGPRGTYLGPADGRFLRGSAVALLVVLGVNLVAGVFKMVPCVGGNYELPQAAYRMCASPLAAALGAQVPQVPPNAVGVAAHVGTSSAGVDTLIATSVLTDWFVRIMAGLGVTIPTAMFMVALINALAWIVTGCVLFKVVTGRQWLIFVVASPLVALTLSQSFDPVGIACVVLAWALLREDSTTRAAAAGALVAAALVVQPLAVVVAVALIVWQVGLKRSGQALVLAGTATIVLGLALMLDARLVGRITQAVNEGVTWGSIVSLIPLDVPTPVLVLVSLGVWAVVSVVTVVAYVRAMAAGRVAPGVALLATVLLAWAVVLLPSSPSSLAVWLVPFAAVSVGSVWALVGWNFAEVAALIAANLLTVGQVDSAKGLAPEWGAGLTIVRLAVVGIVLSVASSRTSVAPPAPPVPPVHYRQKSNSTPNIPE